MNFALAIHAAPFSSQASQTALYFARELLRQGHHLYRIFFYHDGVYLANRLSTPAQDDVDLVSEWRTLAREHDLDVVVCIATALKRGVLNREEARRYERDADNLAPEFTLSGLGQWVDAVVNADRIITFGG